MIDERDIYNIPGPLDLTFLMKMYGLEGFDRLKNKPYTPQPVPEIEADDDIFEKSGNRIFCCTIRTRHLRR